MKNYLVTREWLRANSACYSDAKIAELIPEVGLLMSDVLTLDIPDEDKVWVWCHAECADPADFAAFARFCADRAKAYAATYAERAAAYAYAAAARAAIAATIAATYATRAAAHNAERAAQIAWIIARLEAQP